MCLMLFYVFSDNLEMAFAEMSNYARVRLIEIARDEPSHVFLHLVFSYRYRCEANAYTMAEGSGARGPAEKGGLRVGVLRHHASWTRLMLRPFR
jgi:hypothetical protein